MSLHVFRVIVRGRFDALDDEARADLRADLDEDVAALAFTPEGTLGYDRALDAFGFRVEVRVDADLGPAELGQLARDEGTARLTSHLDARGIGYRGLRATADDMSDVWR